LPSFFTAQFKYISFIITKNQERKKLENKQARVGGCTPGELFRVFLVINGIIIPNVDRLGLERIQNTQSH
jgi:hypothetical protein